MVLGFHSGVRWRRCRFTTPVLLCNTLYGLRLGQVYVYTGSEVHDRCLAGTFSGFRVVATALMGPCAWCTDALRMLNFRIRRTLRLPSCFERVYVLLFVAVHFCGSVGAQTLCGPPHITELRPFLRLLPQAKPKAQRIFTY